MKAILAFAIAFVFAASAASAQSNRVVKPDFAEDCDESTSCDFRAEAYVAVPLECEEEEVMQLGCIERDFDRPRAGQRVIVVADQGNAADQQAAQICIFGDALDQIQISNVNFGDLHWQDPGIQQTAAGSYTGGSAVSQDTIIEALQLNFWSTTTNPTTGPYTPHGNLLTGPGTLNLFLNGNPSVFSSINGNPGSAYVDGWGWVTVRIGGVFGVSNDQQRGTYRGTGSFDVDYTF